nr:S24 family peptidase [Moorella thermoacetica]
MRSTSTVHGHLSRLEKKGYIRWDPLRSRAIEIVEPGPTTTVAENGDIVVALLGEKATVKYFYHYEDHVELVPANSRMLPIKAREVTILGKVIGLLRRFS